MTLVGIMNRFIPEQLEGYQSNPKSVKKSKRGESADYEQNRERTLRKAKSKVHRLIKRYKLQRFVTLTFAENLEEVKLADRIFTNL